MNTLAWLLLAYGVVMTFLFFVAKAGADHELARANRLGAALQAERRRKQIRAVR